LQVIVEAGYGKAVAGLSRDYVGALEDIKAEAVKRGISVNLGVSAEQLTYLQQLNTRELLGRAEDYALRLEKELFSGLASGQGSEFIAERIQDIPLATHQLNVVAHDGVKQFQNTARQKAFEGAKVKWVYIGPNDSVTRDICQEALAAGEVTEKERDRLAAGGPDRGGFNCRHDWMIV
ncbi:MAG: hypothetical protein ACE5D7_07895, partial [Fidelibacterota bacterium]